MTDITEEQLRRAALELLCLWIGVDPDKAPPAWWASPGPGPAARDGWMRVAAEMDRRMKLERIKALMECSEIARNTFKDPAWHPDLRTAAHHVVLEIQEALQKEILS